MFAAQRATRTDDAPELEPEPDATVSLPLAHPSFDVWSLGVVLFELCAGHTLFSQDTANDELIVESDKTRPGFCIRGGGHFT